MATPILENELYKLRLRLGDTHSIGGEEFTPSPSNLSLEGSEWSSKQLVYLWNSAVIAYLQFVAMFQPDEVNRLLPGYIVIYDGTDIKPANGVLKKSVFTPVCANILAISYTVSGKEKPMQYTPPSKWLDVKTNVTANDTLSADKTIYYTEVLYSGDESILFLPKINNTTINIVYIKKHTFVNINDNGDISGFSDYALERILDIAEKKAIKAKEAMNSEILQRDEEFIKQSEITKGVGEFKI